MKELVHLKPKIHIAICTHRFMDPFFACAMFELIQILKDTNIAFEINCVAGVSNIAGGRQARVKEALASDCTHILFLDDDMVFYKDLVHKILAEVNKLTMQGIEKVAMAVNYCKRHFSELHYTAKDLDGNFMNSKGKAGVEEASACGLGIFFMRLDDLRDIPLPHFEIMWLPDKGEHLGEDYYFIRKIREHGVRLFIDNDISQNIGHAGNAIYWYSSYAQKT